MNLAFSNPVTRICVTPLDAELCGRPLPAVALSLACHNAFGGGASKSESNTTNVDKRTAASEGSLAVGSGGSFQEGGVRGSANKIGSTEVGSGSTITVTTADANVLNNALDQIAQLSSGYGSSLNQFVSQASADQSQKVASLLGAVSQAQQSQDSAAQNRKLFLYIALGVLALLAFLGWRKTR